MRDLVVAGIKDNAAAGRLSPALRLAATLIGAHLGLLLLAALASGWRRQRRVRAPEIDRNPLDPLARLFVYVFALTPALAAIVIACSATGSARSAASRRWWCCRGWR